MAVPLCRSPIAQLAALRRDSTPLQPLLGTASRYCAYRSRQQQFRRCSILKLGHGNLSKAKWADSSKRTLSSCGIKHHWQYPNSSSLQLRSLSYASAIRVSQPPIHVPHSRYNDEAVQSLKVDELKKVLDLGGVDYRHCLEKRELVERVVETQAYIPPAAQRLLQRYLEGRDQPWADHLDTKSALMPEEDWWLEAERNTIKVFQEASSSVINITTSTESFLNTTEIPKGTGSGFVWDKNGHIVTNYHVIMNGSRARVTLADTTTWDASVVGVAKNKDLAVVKIDAPASKLNPILVGTSQALQVGQHVLAIGNPFGLDRTLTSGIISGVGRDIRGVTGRLIRGVIQTDASINPGNSGGPLLDSQGRLIGVNTAIYSPSGASAGVGFAIPVDTVRRVVNEIRDGKAVRAGLGIICASDSQAKQVGVLGVLVLDVSPTGGAARAGLRGTSRDAYGRVVLGDVIVAINGQTLSTVEDLLAAFDNRMVGETVRVTVKRGTGTKDYYVTLEEISE